MAANARLVVDAQDCHASLSRERDALSAADANARATENGRLARMLGTSPEDWTHAAETGALLLRTPCTTPRGEGTLYVHRSRRIGISRGSGSRGPWVRGEAAGLSHEEVVAVSDAYERAHASTWTKMKESCERLSPPEERESAEGATEAPSPADLVARCRLEVLPRIDRPALARAAEVVRAGKPPSRASTPEETVLVALGEMPAELARALEETLGVDKARRAAAYGMLCMDESVVFAPAPSQDPT